MAIIPRWKRLLNRDWKDPFEWFAWRQMADPKVLFRYAPMGRNYTGAMTFSRADASTCATYVDANGIVQTVAANVLRNQHYINGVGPYTLLEGSRVNSALGSCSFSDDTYWNQSALFTINTATSCIAGQTAYTHTAAAGNKARVQTIGTFAAGQKDCLCMIVDKGTATQTQFGIYNATTPGFTILGRIQNWNTTPVFDVNAGAGTGGIVSLGGTRYLIWCASDGSATAGNVRQAWLYPAGQSTGSLTIHYVGFETNAAFPSSPIVTAASAVTRAADDLQFAIGFPPQALTMYLDVTNSGLAGTSLVEYRCIIGNTGYAGGTKLFFMNISGSGQVNALASDGSTTANFAASTVYATTDRMESCCSWSSAGTLSLASSKNGAAQETPATATQAQPSTWTSNVLAFQNGGGAGTGYQWTCVRSIKIAAGVQSLNTMRTL